MRKSDSVLVPRASLRNKRPFSGNGYILAGFVVRGCDTR